MKKISTVTFHRAQNYGSALQTYALQEFVKKTCSLHGEELEYQVLDVQPKTQEQLYSIYKKGFSVSNIIKNTVAFFCYKKLKNKQQRFQSFLSEYVNLSKRYEIADLYNGIDSGDYFISGSDQIWNVRSLDFEDYFYLDFVKNAKKVSYAASFGPLKIDWSKYDAEKYAKLLKEYSSLSTREEGSASNVKLLIDVNPDIHVDPTLLLSKEEWKEVQSLANYKNGKYILLYCLEPTRQQLKLAKAISKKIKLPIVVTKYNNKNDIINGFVKKYDCGPRDFLSYIDNAALVLTSSFHGTAFSLIYKKKFFVLNGKTDNRICDILSKTRLLDRSIEDFSEIEKVNLDSVDFAYVDEFLASQKQKSEEYFTKALEI